MLGLFGTLNMGTRSLATQQLGTEIAGNNLANVNTPGYARQRIQIQSGISVPSILGPQGTGADGVAISQIRDAVLDRQMLGETSLKGQLTTRQKGLQSIQAGLGQQISTTGSAQKNGLADDLTALFTAFQSVSISPTDLAERQVLIGNAQNLADHLNQVSGRLGNVEAGLNDSITGDVKQANLLLTEISRLNAEITRTESGGGTANELRDTRQQRLESLSALVKIKTSTGADGTFSVGVDGQTLVNGAVLNDTLQTYDSGGGKLMVRTAQAQTNLNPGGGSIQGGIDARDVSLAAVRGNIDQMASTLIARVNAIHSAGFSLTGSTGAVLFTGTDAGSIKVNPAIVADSRLIQASATAGATGNNKVMLQLAQLASDPQGTLQGLTLSGHYNQSVAALGQDLASVNTEIGNQDTVQKMLVRQRDSVMGVSVDEEMTSLIKYQKAFQASAKLITTIDKMLDTVINLKA